MCVSAGDDGGLRSQSTDGDGGAGGIGGNATNGQGGNGGIGLHSNIGGMGSYYIVWRWKRRRELERSRRKWGLGGGEFGGSCGANGTPYQQHGFDGAFDAGGGGTWFYPPPPSPSSRCTWVPGLGCGDCILMLPG